MFEFTSTLLLFNPVVTFLTLFNFDKKYSSNPCTDQNQQQTDEDSTLTNKFYHSMDMTFLKRWKGPVFSILCSAVCLRGFYEKIKSEQLFKVVDKDVFIAL